MSSLEVPDADIKVPQTLVDRVTAVLQVSCKRDVESVIAIVAYNFTKLFFEWKVQICTSVSENKYAAYVKVTLDYLLNR